MPVFAGTSGFAYPAWKPAFYPKNVASKNFLNYYATRLNCVEVNYTYRQLPKSTTLEGWVNATPEGFLFAPKAHMKLTHILRLKNAAEFTEVFLRAIDPLRSARRLGPILYQLPPNLKCDQSLLSDYLALLPRDLRFAFEFRHESWLTDSVYELLSSHGVCLCLAESDKLEIPKVFTADFAYFRLRKGDYPVEERQRIAAQVQELANAGRNVFVFFKHEDDPAGALYAEELLTHA
ncbi:MAG TPA: DUF72 domain-containing protein [Bryobacteraceae bacterium]|jgi:uncharacterized protein YecE (DUF72 family)